MNLEKELSKLNRRSTSQANKQAEARRKVNQKWIESMKYWTESPLGNN